MNSFYVDSLNKEYKYCIVCGIKLNNRYKHTICLKCMLKEEQHE